MTNRVLDRPDYECDVCNRPMTEHTVKYRTFLNNHQYVFCSIGCYYTWAEGANLPYPEEEEYN